MAVDIRIPRSPIHAMVNTPGDATHSPLIQLLNPGASGVDIVIYEITIGQEGITNRMRMRRTNAPLTGAGTQSIGLTARMDERDATAIVGTLSGWTATVVTGITEANSFWFDKPATAGGAGYLEQPIIRPGAYPLILKPGSGLEFCATDLGAAVLARLRAVWDEYPRP
jgi:hypothetical protein